MITLQLQYARVTREGSQHVVSVGGGSEPSWIVFRKFRSMQAAHDCARKWDAATRRGNNNQAAAE